MVSDLVQLNVADRPVAIEASKCNTTIAITPWDGVAMVLESDFAQLNVADRPLAIEASKRNISTAITLWDGGAQGWLVSDLVQHEGNDRPFTSVDIHAAVGS